MTEIVWKETKQDGWSYSLESGPGGIYSMDEDIWMKVCLAVTCGSSEFMNARGNELSKGERKAIIRQYIDIELEALKERLESDLEASVKIYPLVQKKGVRS